MSRPRRQRRLARGVLMLAATLAIVAFPVRATWWGGWVLAIAEAGIVGGLADWFAVTAIFRRPLGLPIPHTALIPSNWELMAVRVGTMVGDRVLTKDYVTGEIERIDVAELLAHAAQRVTREDLETVTAAVAEWVARALPPTAGADLLARLRRLVATQPIAPTLASAIELAHEHGWDQRALGAAAHALGEALERPAFRRAIAGVVDEVLHRYRERMPPYPRLVLGLADLLGFIDRERLVTALAVGVSEVARDPEHPLRRQIAETIAALPKGLRTDPALAARVEAAKVELLDSELARRLADELLAELKRVLGTALADPRSEVIAWVVDRLDRARLAVETDAALRADVDRWLKREVIGLVARYHTRIATFIENGVRALGPEGAVRLIEEHAGDDLQYIRVNGTVVGGLAGGALYAVHLLLRLL